jgi:uncharacterized membrane protein
MGHLTNVQRQLPTGEVVVTGQISVAQVSEVHNHPLIAWGNYLQGRVDCLGELPAGKCDCLG